MFIPITLLMGLTLLPLGSRAQPGGHVRACDHGGGGHLDGVHRTGHRGRLRPPYGALKRLGATALPGWGIIAGKSRPW